MKWYDNQEGKINNSNNHPSLHMLTSASVLLVSLCLLCAVSITKLFHICFVEISPICSKLQPSSIDE
jgi:hypothetical protein